MPTAVGPNTKGEENLIFGYDLGDVQNSYKGSPTTNTWNNNTYSYTWDNASVERNATPPIPPPKEARGFEIIKLTSTDGTNAQTIPWTSQVDQVNGGTYTHSVYVYLQSGTNVQVGQHWNPWAYGSAQSPPVGKWVRLSQVVTNSANNYGNIANAYITNGVAYFTATQYELGSVMSPFVLGTRSATQGLLDLKGDSTIDLSNVSFDSDAQMTFDGSDDYIPVSPIARLAVTESWSVELVFKPTDGSDTSWNGLFGGYLGGGGYWMFHNGGKLTYYEGYSGGSLIRYSTWDKSNTFTTGDFHHLTLAYTPLSSTQGKFTIYYNGGEKVDEFTWTFTFGYSLDWRFLGGNCDGSRFGTNDIHVAKRYNRTLTASEIKANYNAIKGRFNI